MKNIIKIIAILITVAIFSSTSAAYATLDNENLDGTEEVDEEGREKDDEEGEDKDKDLGQDYRFNEEIFEQMVDIFVDEYFPFEGYKTEMLNNKKVLLFNPKKMNTKKYDSKILSTTTKIVEEGIPGYKFKNKYRGYNEIYTQAIWNSSGKKYDGALVTLDNYGNVIAGDVVVVPFFMNSMFINDEDMVSSPLTKNEIKSLDKIWRDKSDTTSKSINNPLYFSLRGERKYLYDEGEVLRPAYGGKDERKFLRNKAKDSLESLIDMEGIYQIDKEKTKEYIINTYRDKVQEYNEQFIGEFLVDSEKFSIDIQDKLTMDELKEIDNIGDLVRQIFKVGAGEIIKLTVASAVDEVYDELFIKFSGRYIFDTPTLEESDSFRNIVGFYFVIIIIIMCLYVILTAFYILIGKSGVEDSIKRIVIVILVITLPIAIYSKVVEYTFNKPVQTIQSNEINKIMILDRWALLAKQDMEERLEETIWGSASRFRGTNYNYLIEIKTNTFTDDKSGQNKIADLEDKYRDNEVELDKQKSSIKDKRATIVVDINHLLNYVKDTYSDSYDEEEEEEGEVEDGVEGGEYNEEEFISYLINNETDNYLGLTEEFTEYEAFFGEGLIDGRNSIKTTDLIKRVFRFYETGEEDLAENIFLLNDCLTDSKISMTNVERESLINQMSSTEEYTEDLLGEYYTGKTIEDFDDNEREFLKYSTISELMDKTNKGDILNIYELINFVTDDRIDEENYLRLGVRGKNIDVEQLVINTNRKVIDDFMKENYFIRKYIASKSSDEQSYYDAENDIIKLKIALCILEELDDPNVPTDLSANKVEPDIYMRSLTIPVTSITPENKFIDTAAIFICTSTSLISMIIFLIFLLMLVIYGLLKLMIISVLLLPVFLILTLVEYVIKDNFGSKLYFGALYIIGLFALINFGLVAIWRICSFMMNNQFINATCIGGTNIFFIPAVNMLIITLYLGLVSKYVIVPTLKTVKSNIGDLGGSVFYEKSVGAIDKVSKAVKKAPLFNGSSSNNNIESLGSVNLNKDSTENNIEKEKIRDREDAIRNRRYYEDNDDELTGEDAETGRRIDREIIRRRGELEQRDSFGVREEKVQENKGIQVKSELVRKDKIESGDIKLEGEGTGGNIEGTEIVFKLKEHAIEASKLLEKQGLKTKIDGNKLKVNKDAEEVKNMQQTINNHVHNKVDNVDGSMGGSSIKEIVNNSNLVEGEDYIIKADKYEAKTRKAEKIIGKFYENKDSGDSRDSREDVIIQINKDDYFGGNKTYKRVHRIEGLNYTEKVNGFLKDIEKGNENSDLAGECKEILHDIKFENNVVKVTTEPEISQNRVKKLFEQIDELSRD